MSLLKPPCLEGSGNGVSQQRDVASFNSIVLNVEATVTVAQGENQSLEITAQENLLPIITTEVSDSTLTIADTECFSTSVGVTLNATIPTLQGVTVTSSGHVNGSGLSLSGAEIKVSSSGGVSLTDITGTTVGVKISSSGSVELTGTAQELNINLSASGNATADNCTAQSCSVTVSGSGDVHVHVIENLNATISGSGNIYYQGNPTIEKNITGSGKLIQVA